MASPALLETRAQLLAMRGSQLGLEVDPLRVRGLMNALATQPPPGLDVRRFSIGPRSLHAEWVLPTGSESGARLVYLHGGAYVAGSPATHRALATRIARRAGCVALVPDYRLAPEHAFPAAVEDALDAVEHAMENGPDGPSRARRVVIAGDSAGGGLTLATLLALRDRGRPLPARAATLSAWTDLACTGDSVQRMADIDPMLDAGALVATAQHYLAGADPREPLASPLYGELAGLPPLLMQVGGHEVLLDDTLRFADRAARAGVDVTLAVFDEAFHVFQAFASSVPEARQAVEDLGAFLRAG